MLEGTEARRAAITEKCKTLLTLSSLFLTLVGFLLSRTYFDSKWVWLFFTLAALAFLNVVTLLVVFFGVRAETHVQLNQKDANLDEQGLQRALIKSYLITMSDIDQRTNFLADVYKVARFFFLFAFTLLVMTIVVNLHFADASSRAKAVARELKTDANFLLSVKGSSGVPGQRGDKGDTGEKGARGDKGERGEKGEPGIKGERGEAGQKGEKGDPGPKGDPGIKS